MKTPTTIDEFHATLHALVDGGQFHQFGDGDQAKAVMDELISVLRKVHQGSRRLTSFEAAVVQSVLRIVEPFLEHEDGTDKDDSGSAGQI